MTADKVVQRLPGIDRGLVRPQGVAPAQYLFKHFRCNRRLRALGRIVSGVHAVPIIALFR
jgi:hypothetical protein